MDSLRAGSISLHPATCEMQIDEEQEGLERLTSEIESLNVRTLCSIIRHCVLSLPTDAADKAGD